jgi:outer membrane biosynthesis protein TonB
LDVSKNTALQKLDCSDNKLTILDVSRNTALQKLNGARVAAGLTGGGAGAAGLTGRRSRASIMRVVRQNMASLQYAYNQRREDNPGMQGRVTVKWAIDEFGNVIFCKLVGSTISDYTFEQTVIDKIKLWAFGKIDIPEDITEVEYPFVFTPD